MTPMRRIHMLIALTAALIMGSSAVLAGLAEDIDIAIRSSGLDGAVVAVSVRDPNADMSEPLVSIRADRPMLPASNMKLYTTGAALHVLGPRFEFVTTLRRSGDRLVIVADGDPAFGDPELLEVMQLGDDVGIDVDTFLDIWADAVAEADLPRVDELVVDDRIFDRDFVHEGWPVDQLNRGYCAQVSGLNFHLNVIHFFPRPGEITVRHQPRGPGLDLESRATSDTSPNAASSVWVARRAGTNKMVFYGNVRGRHTSPLPVTLHDMPQFFAGVLERRLDEKGVNVGSVRTALPDDEFEGGEQIGPRITTPIGTAVTRCNRDSENLYAEALIKRIGHQVTGEAGSWVNGRAVVRHVVHERLGDRFTTAVTVDDGSGLSRGNRVTASGTTAWLTSFHHDPELGEIFADSLAVGGRSGTLRKRFRNTDLHGAVVQAKSGYINGVVCLSGYVTTADGRRRCFSILVNDVTRPNLTATKRMQEKVVALVAADMAKVGVTLGSDD